MSQTTTTPEPSKQGPIVHPEKPYCDNPFCPCHEEREQYAQLIFDPLYDGLITNHEALRIFWNRQV